MIQDVIDNLFMLPHCYLIYLVLLYIYVAPQEEKM